MSFESFLYYYSEALSKTVVLYVSVVESAAGVVASAKTGAEMIEDSSKHIEIL